jgi:hypothetical protein
MLRDPLIGMRYVNRIYSLDITKVISKSVVKDLKKSRTQLRKTQTV